jgi:hypothetical protein
VVLLGCMVGTDSIVPTTGTVMSASLLIGEHELFTACAFCTWTKKTELKNMQVKRQNEQRKRHAAAVDEHKKTVHDATRASPSSLGSLWPVARTDKRLKTRCHRCDTLIVSAGGAPDNTRHSQQLLRHGKKLERHECPEGGLSLTTRRPLAVFKHMAAEELRRHSWATKSRCSPRTRAPHPYPHPRSSLRFTSTPTPTPR